MDFSLVQELIRVIGELGPEFLGLGVMTVFVPAFISLLKFLGLEDGQAGTANMIVEGLLFVAFVGASLFVPDFDLTSVDGILAEAGRILVTILTFLGQLKLSQQTWVRFWRGRKLVGYSHSLMNG
jgi:hypothetical protein